MYITAVSVPVTRRCAKRMRAAITFTSSRLMPFNSGSCWAGMCSVPSLAMVGITAKKSEVVACRLKRKRVKSPGLSFPAAMSILLSRFTWPPSQGTSRWAAKALRTRRPCLLASPKRRAARRVAVVCRTECGILRMK